GRLGEVSWEPEVVLGDKVGNNVSQVAGDVIAAFRRRESDLLKATDSDIRSTQNRLAVIGCIRAQEKAQGFGVEAIVEIVKDLVEVVDAYDHLVSQSLREGA